MEKYILVHWPESQDYMEEEGVVFVMNDKDLNNSDYLVPVRLYKEIRTRKFLEDLVTKTLTDLRIEGGTIKEIAENITIIQQQ